MVFGWFQIGYCKYFFLSWIELIAHIAQKQFKVYTAYEAKASRWSIGKYFFSGTGLSVQDHYNFRLADLYNTHIATW